MQEFESIVRLIHETRGRALQSINTELVTLYYRIGSVISKRMLASAWGEKTVNDLAAFIKSEDPALKGFDRRGLYRMKQFYETYVNTPLAPPDYEESSIVTPAVTQYTQTDVAKIVSPLVTQIPWTHNLVILSKTHTHEERTFYLLLTIKDKLSKRDLEREIESGKFERTQIAGKQVVSGNHPAAHKIAAVFKDTYIAEFLDLPERYSESDLQYGLVSQMKKFILELGKDFIFIDQEFRVQVGAHDYFIDLLFYHRDLQCLVAFELKTDEFRPEYLGKLNFYLEALDRDVRKLHENPSIGVLLCKTKDSEVVEYAMSRNLSPALVAEYRTKMPDKKLLQQRMHEIIES